MRITGDEAMFGISVHEIALGRPRPGYLLLRDGVRPQPSRIDVTVCNAEALDVLLVVVDPRALLLPAFAEDLLG